MLFRSVINAGESGDNLWVVDTHAVVTISGRGGEDTFLTFGNSEICYQYGDAGDDTFYVFASLEPENDETVTVNGGAASEAGNKIYQYRQNAKLKINGGTGSDRLVISLTILDDVLVIEGGSVKGAGLDIDFEEIEELVIAGLDGADTFYIKSLTIPLVIRGEGKRPGLPELPPGVVLPDLDGGYEPSESLDDTIYIGWAGPGLPADLSGIQAPITVYGNDGYDFVYINNTGDMANRNFVLGLVDVIDEAPVTVGSITETTSSKTFRVDNSVEELHLWLGLGNDSVTVDATMANIQTAIAGGRGNEIGRAHV